MAKQQLDLKSVKYWVDKWYLCLNLNKFKIASYGKSTDIQTVIYAIILLSQMLIVSYKKSYIHLKVLVASILWFSDQIYENVANANRMLGLIMQQFSYSSINSLSTLYQALERPQKILMQYSVLTRKRAQNNYVRQIWATKLGGKVNKLPNEKNLKLKNLPLIDVWIWEDFVV